MNYNSMIWSFGRRVYLNWKLVSPPRIAEPRPRRSPLTSNLGAAPIAMRMRSLAFLSAFSLFINVHAQGPDLVGYWHNWSDGNAPYL